MSKLKFAIVFSIIFFGVLFFASQSAQAAIIFQENWDLGTPPAGWPCQTYPGTCTGLSFNGWVQRQYYCEYDWGLSTGLSNSIYHSSPRSFHLVQGIDDSEGCTVIKAIPQPNPAKIYFRFYAYFPSGGATGWNQWTHSSAEAWDDSNHFIFLNTAAVADNRIVIDITDSSHGPFSGSPLIPPCYLAGQNGAFFRLFYGSNVLFSPNSAYCWNIFDHLDTWNSFEFMFDLSNSKYAFWINGEQAVGTGGAGVNQSFPNVTNFTNVILSLFKSGNIHHGTEYYIDDIVVSDSYIGPTGSVDTTPPAAPSGVTVS